MAELSSNTANSVLTTTFDLAPYHDDYAPSKKHYRLLFRPGYAVQARELTQMQSMIQAQIYRFGRHIFKEGSIVLPGHFNVRVNTGDVKGNPIDYVKLRAVDLANNEVDVEDFIGETVVGQTSNIAAQVVTVLDSDGTSANTKTLYVTYLSASPANSQIRQFIAGETLLSANAGTCIVTNNDPIANVGYASFFEISEGVIFAKDHFIWFPTQSVVLDRYNANPSCQVGFYVREDIIRFTEDASLLDPALESSNYSAPGADRFMLDAQLSVVNFDEDPGVDFVSLFRVRNGITQTTSEKTEYNILGDTLAGRTYEESGDYVVRGLNVQVNEHDLVTSPVNNFGRFANGNNELLMVTIDPGYAYIKGYPVQQFDKYEIEIAKPREYKNAEQQIISTSMGQYIRVNEFVGSWELDKSKRIKFYDVPQKRINNGGSPTSIKWSTGAQTGNNIGSGIVSAVQYVTGTHGYDAQWDIYLSDIKMNGVNSFANVKSVYYDNSPYSDIGADLVGATVGIANTSLRDTTLAALLFPVGKEFVRSVRDADGTASATYYFNKTEGISSGLSLSTNGTMTLVISGPANEILPYGTTTVSEIDVTQDIIMTVNETFNIGPLDGAISANGTAIIGAGTFFTRLNPGDKFEVAGHSSNTYYVAAVANNTYMTASVALPASVTGNSIFKAYKTGDILNLGGKGVTNGTDRTVQATPTSLTFDIKETLPQEVDVTVSYKLASTQSTEAAKALRPNRYVIIDCSTAGTRGPFCLGFSDVLRIRNVIQKNASAPANLADGTNVTNFFRLDNGQRDTRYDLGHALKSAGLTLAADDFLLFEIDYFYPIYSTRAGFFTVDSYPVEDNDANTSNSNIRTENIPVYVSPTTSLRYDLRNMIDFRPVKNLTANDSVAIGVTTSINPSNNSPTYNFSASGMKFPVPSTEFVYDYSYYIGRYDVVVGTKDNRPTVIKGVPHQNPIVPDIPDTQMLLSIIRVTPYPSLSPSYANALGRKDLAVIPRKSSNRRYTMRDIGVLDQRLTNIELYTSLTLLEKNALELKVLDEDGLDRFKNGIFIDTFRDTSLSAKGVDRDYRIVTDPIELAIRPLFSTESFGYDYLSGSGVTNHNGIITMNYTDEFFFENKKVTDVRNLERGTFYFNGSMTLVPPQDLWIDTSFAPDEIVAIDAHDALLEINVESQGAVNQTAQMRKSLINTEWEGWKATITGYSLYRGEGTNKTFVGNFTTYALAQQAAAAWTTAQNGGVASIETLYNNARVGTNYFANESTDQAAGSNKLISSEVIPYIRPQTISIRCANLKPYSLMHAFFDGVNVDAWVTPLTEAQSAKAIAGLPINDLVAEGTQLVVNQDGTLYFNFRIADNGPKFRIGERKMIVIDGIQLAPVVISSEDDASTTAVGTFFADGTKQTLQRTVYSTDSYLKTAEATAENYNSKTVQVLPNTWRPPPPPKQHCCFSANALVCMEDGSKKAIKDIVAGDRVRGLSGVNTVIKNKSISPRGRNMIKFDGYDFYTTADHLFMTDKGWKTWEPHIAINEDHSINGIYLEGKNRYESITSGDKLSIDGQWVDYDDLDLTFFKFEEDELEDVYDLTLDGDCTYFVNGFLVHNCCIAYGVLIRTPADEEGLFTTGFDIYVGRKSATRGLWFEIREMDTGGGITSTQIPGTEVHLPNASVNVSTNGLNNPTEVRFAAPVFLFNNQQYAFVVHSDSPVASNVDPDTQLWISRLGETDINTGEKISDRQKTGTFFQTSDNKNWDNIPDIDLRIDIQRAKFTTGTTQFIIGNKPVEKLFLRDLSNPLAGRVGEYFITGDTMTFTTANGTIQMGQRAVGNISLGAANGTVVNISGSNYILSNTGYIKGEKVNFFDANGIYSGVSCNVATVSNATAVLAYVDETSANVYTEWVKSTGNFSANDVIRSLTNGGFQYRGVISDVEDFRYSSVSFEPRVLDFVKTGIAYGMKTYTTDTEFAATASGFETIYPSETFYYIDEKKIYGKTHELDDLAGQQSNQVQVEFQSISEWVSPVLNLNTTQTIYIDNIINANTDGETGTSGGQAYNKYISQTVTLDDGQDAEDIKVILTAYRPPGTDVKVYVKLLHNDDGDTLAQKSWIELEKEGDGPSVYSAISNRFNYREYKYNLPSSVKTGPDGQVQYTALSTFTGYKTFAIKIVLTADQSAVVPRCADLRVLAIQM
jgi:hypothetical protein